jgi:hypothetical protein
VVDRAFESVGRRLGAIRSELNALRRARRADVCERIKAHGNDASAAHDETPCFKLANLQAEGHGIHPLCPACERNGQRAMREANLRHRSGAALRALQMMHEASMPMEEARGS